MLTRLHVHGAWARLPLHNNVYLTRAGHDQRRSSRAARLAVVCRRRGLVASVVSPPACTVCLVAVGQARLGSAGSSGLTFNQLLTLARDFNFVPRHCSMTQLLDLFAAVNSADKCVTLVFELRSCVSGSRCGGEEIFLHVMSKRRVVPCCADV